MMIARYLGTAAALLFGAAVALGTLHAQNVELLPHPSGDAVAVAAEAAHNMLAADAVPVFIGAVGDGMYDAGGGNVVRLRFDPATGLSTAWEFAFYSASKGERMFFAAVDIPFGGGTHQYQAIPNTPPVTIPDLHEALNLTLPFATSDRFAQRLATDSVYRGYRAQYPVASAEAVALRPINVQDSVLLPPAFPHNAPVWKMTFAGTGDAAMICYVSAGSGDVYCARNAVLGVPREGMIEGGPRLTGPASASRAEATAQGAQNR